VRASLVAHGRYLEITQRGNETTFSCGDEEFEGIWKRYFDLERDYGGIVRCAMDAGGHLRDAASCGGGLRILRQELWETLVTFIISQQNNITRIRRSVAALCERFGEGKTAWVWRGGGYAQGGHAPPQTGGGGVWPIGARCGDGQPGGANDESDGSGISGSAGYGGGDPAGCVSVGYHSFPTPEALAAATPEEMSACGLGYRGPYIIKTARQVLQGDVDLDGIAGMDYPQAREALKTLSGVGNKVADCVCLFALGHLDAFPVDTHIKQALGRHYPEGFPQGDFDGISGIMQQYLFYYELHGRAKSVPVQ
jgi:N-glycosylase/DNA lyase